VSLLDDIRAAQILAGEAVVIQSLKQSGLVTEPLRLVAPPDEISALRARLAAAEARAERCERALEWIRRKLFVQSWSGTLGAPQDWRIAGDYRHTTQRMKGPTLLDAVESAALAEGEAG